MKRLFKIGALAALVLLLALALPTIGLAAGPNTKLILGETYTLANGEILNENLTILGGTVTLEEGSTVNGNIVVLGGNVSMAGLVNGDITAAGGTLDLLKTAVISGNIRSAGAIVSRADGSIVKGTITNEDQTQVSIPLVNGAPWLSLKNVFGPVLNVLGFFVWVFILSALAVLVAMFLPSQTQRVNQALLSQPLISFGFGLITLIVAPFAMIAMAVTLILIPAVPLLAFVMLALILLGWIAFGLEIGRRFAGMLHREWAAPLEAGLGTLALTVVFGGLAFFPCIGWLPLFILASAGLGAVFLTRFGTRPYFPGASTPIPPAVPPGSPLPVAPEPMPGPVLQGPENPPVEPPKADPASG